MISGKGGKPRNLFDIVGPVMVGPSSSHTAGRRSACRTRAPQYRSRCTDRRRESDGNRAVRRDPQWRRADRRRGSDGTIRSAPSADPRKSCWKTPMVTMSSRTAMGSRARVTGPLVWNSCTMESAGAGAVASAMPPNASARYSGGITTASQNSRAKSGFFREKSIHFWNSNTNRPCG